MLERRIQGVMRQYPDPYVAFYTLEILLVPDSEYLLAPKDLSNIRRVGADPLHLRIWESMTPDERVQDAIKRSAVSMQHYLKHHPDTKSGLDEWSFAKPDLSPVERIRRYVTDYVQRGKWWNHETLETNRYDAIVPYVAAMVARWRKGIVPYESIVKLRKKASGIADWASATHPNIMGLGVSQVLARTARWHADMARRASMKKAKAGEVVYAFPDGWTFERLRERDQLCAEGESQGICVGQDTYVQGVTNKSGGMAIFSLRDPEGVPHVTVEAVSLPPGGVGVWSAKQIKGRGNAMIKKPALCQRLAEAFRALRISAVNASDWTGDDWPSASDRSKACWKQDLDRWRRKRLHVQAERRENPVWNDRVHQRAYGRP